MSQNFGCLKEKRRRV